MFKQNYLNELPDDCVKLIYKNVFDMSVKNIKNCPLNKNIDYYYALQDMMIDEEDTDFHFPYLQVVSRKVNTNLKYLYDCVDGNCYFPKYKKLIEEQRWIEANAHKYFKPNVAHAKRVDAGLANARKMLTDDHHIRFIRIRSDNLLFIHKNNQYLHRKLRKYISGHYRTDCDTCFNAYIDKGDIVIVFDDESFSMDCLAELLYGFTDIALYVVDNLLDGFLFEMFAERDEIVRTTNPDDLNYILDPIEFNLRRIREVLDELELNDFLTDCNIKLEGETAILTKHKPVNVIGIGGDESDEEWETTDEETDED